LMPRLSAIPGTESVAVTSNLPMGGAARWKLELEGDAPVELEKRPNIWALIVGPNYFRIAGQQLLRGSDFGDADGATGKPVVIVNQSFAKKYWPNGNPVGKRLRLHRKPELPWLTVVGVSPDTKQVDQRRVEIDPLVYIPYRQDPLRDFQIVALTGVAPETLVAAFRKEVAAIDEEVPVSAVITLERWYSDRRWEYQVFGTLFVVFALIALLLASVGIYAVMAYSVSQRTQEIGVRLALGATGPNIVRLVMQRGLIQLAAGLIIGLGGALGLTKVMQGLLVAVQPKDPVTFVTITSVLLGSGLAACLIPARRATRVDPVIALRYE
ncbi:MAG: FtsX-like permease family protein, partial [Bryobacteraceae bacterium]